jgi:hypothetical protein
MATKLSRNILCAVLMGCFLSKNLYVQENVHPVPSLLSTEILAQTAIQCRKTIDQLWEARRSLKPEQMRDFQIAVGQASKNCDDLQEIYTQTGRASQLKQDYDQALASAQTLVNGQISAPAL